MSLPTKVQLILEVWLLSSFNIKIQLTHVTLYKHFAILLFGQFSVDSCDTLTYIPQGEVTDNVKINMVSVK